MKINVKSDCRGMSVEDTIEQIFEDRGIEDSWHFMHPTEDDLLPLDALKNITRAAEILILHVEFGNKIGILFDTDCDGITSGSIMYRYLKHLGVEPVTFINHGKAHGLQSDDLEKYKDCRLLIIVDSLDSTIDNYVNVQKNSDITDVIVLDHHAINPDIPYDDWVTLVSSQRDYGNPQLSGAGVVWKFCKYLDSLRNDNFANSLVDLATAGIVADMMDMTSMENRYIASEGFKEVNNLALKKIGGGFEWNAKAVAFSVAPIVNASNRLDENQEAMQAFISDDNSDILSHIRVLKKCKENQNKEVDKLMPTIQSQIDKQLDRKSLWIQIKTPYGIGGLIANRLLEQYKRPIIIVQDCGDVYAGSMRGIGIDDFRQFINDSGLATSNGHELAAGISVPKENRKAFVDYLEKNLPDVGAYEESIDADIQVDVNDIDRNYIDELQKVNKISGTGFQPIKVYVDGITDFHVTDMSGGKHLVIELEDSNLKLIKWNFSDDWEKFQDAELFCDELEAVIQLQSGFIGRTFMLQGIIDYIGVKG